MSECLKKYKQATIPELKVWPFTLQCAFDHLLSYFILAKHKAQLEHLQLVMSICNSVVHVFMRVLTSIDHRKSAWSARTALTSWSITSTLWRRTLLEVLVSLVNNGHAFVIACICSAICSESMPHGFNSGPYNINTNVTQFSLSVTHLRKRRWATCRVDGRADGSQPWRA